MHPLQVVVVLTLVVGAAVYVVRGVKRGIRAEDTFFTALVEKLVQVLEPKGFRLTRQLHRPKSFGHRLATFQGPAFRIELVLDGKERDIRLERVDDESARMVLAEASVSHHATASDYAAASRAMLDAAARI